MGSSPSSSSPSSSSQSNSDKTKTLALVDDILEDCFARVPISHHPLVSQVSKMINDFVVSRKVYRKRLSIQHSESVLYVSLGPLAGNFVDWYVLTKKPYKNEFVLREVPYFPSLPSTSNALVASGSNIYALGGYKDDDFTTDVYAIDCVSYNTASVPKMNEVRHCPDIAVIDETLYVIGGSCNDDVWVESLKLKPRSKWEHVPSVLHSKSVPFDNTVVVMNRKIYFLNNQGDCYVYDPKEDRLDKEEALGARNYRISCVVDDMLYTFARNQIDVYDPKEMIWRALKGVENLLELQETWKMEMVNYGGRLLIIHNAVPEEIWCIEISLERRGAETWGNVISSNRALHGLSDSTEIQHCLVLEI